MSTALVSFFYAHSIKGLINNSPSRLLINCNRDNASSLNQRKARTHRVINIRRTPGRAPALIFLFNNKAVKRAILRGESRPINYKNERECSPQQALALILTTRAREAIQVSHNILLQSPRADYVNTYYILTVARVVKAGLVQHESRIKTSP